MMSHQADAPYAKKQAFLGKTFIDWNYVFHVPYDEVGMSNLTIDVKLDGYQDAKSSIYLMCAADKAPDS